MPDSESSRPRRYPRRRLTGPITVTHSVRPKYPKLHLLDDCEGLQATPEEARATTAFPNAAALATLDWARPCRMCALESVLISCGDPKPAQARTVFVTFTSQASPRNPDASPLSYDWHAATTSGAARLHRLAKRLGLQVTSTISGPAAYGMTTPAGAAAIAANLRSIVRPEQVDPVEAAVVSTLWTLLGDNPPELAEVLGEDLPLDPWTAAVLLSA